MSIRFTRVGVVALLAATVTTTAISSLAGAAIVDSKSVAVRTNDLDLTSSAGAQRLRSRVVRAAHAVCGGYDNRDLSAMSAAQVCRKVALEEAAPRIEVAIAAARGGKAVATNTVRVDAYAH